MSEWRYFVTEVDGINPPVMVIPDLHLENVRITDRLNASAELTATVPIELAGLRRRGAPPFIKTWGHAVWAEASGQIRGGGLLVSSDFTGHQWGITCMGLSGYLDEQPYDGEIYWTDQDPLDIVRHVWEHQQALPGADLGVLVDDTTSPVRIGREVPGDEYDPGFESPTFEDGPYRLAWYETDDLGAVINDLAESTPFDWRETRRWSADRTQVETKIELGYPRLGRRRDDLRFAVGENVFVEPSQAIDEESWASHCVLLGAGEGRDMVRGTASRGLAGRVRRTRVISAKDVKRRALAGKKARRALARIDGNPVLSSITVVDHPHAPLGSWHVGDEIYVRITGGWAPTATWHRIIESTISPGDANVATLGLERSDQGVLV